MQDGESSIQVARDITPHNVIETIPVCKIIGLQRTKLLAEVDPEMWIEIIPYLRDWTLDINWPSSRVILPLLVSSSVTIRATIPWVESVLLRTGPEGEGAAPNFTRDDEHHSILINHFCGKIDAEHIRDMLSTLIFFRRNTTADLEENWGWLQDVDLLIAKAETAISGN